MNDDCIANTDYSGGLRRSEPRARMLLRYSDRRRNASRLLSTPCCHDARVGVQTVEDIRLIMKTAQTTPNRYNFNSTDHDQDLDYQDMMIDATMQEEGLSDELEPKRHATHHAAAGKPAPAAARVG